MPVLIVNRLLIILCLLGPACFCDRGATAHAQVIRSGPPSCPGVALTFDLCPVRKASGYDSPLIEYLIDHRIPATFFMSGKWMIAHDDEIARLLRVEFFEFGTHGEVHAHLPLLSADQQRQEILRPVSRLRDQYAHHASLFRPPYGEYNDLTVELVKALGLRFIQWSLESGDPDLQLSTEHILTRVDSRTKPGSILVFHANGKGRHTREVIERLTRDVLPRKGLTPMTVSDLITCNRPTP